MKAHTPAQLRTLDDAVDFLYQVAQRPHIKPLLPAGVILVEEITDYRDYYAVNTEHLTLILNTWVNAHNLDDKTNISVYPRHYSTDKTIAKNVVQHLEAGGQFVSMGLKRLIWEC
jgi:hypothetical protein